MRERTGGPGEVDQHVGGAERGVDVRGNDRPGDAAKALACVTPDRRTVGDVERGGERAVGSGERGLDQRLAHAAAGARDREPDPHGATS